MCFFRAQFTACITLHQSLAVVQHCSLCTLTEKNICCERALNISHVNRKATPCIWQRKTAERCIHYHESLSRLPPACCYQWEHRARLPRIRVESAGLMRCAHTSANTRKHQSQRDGCSSVGGLDTLANRALVKQLTTHLSLSKLGREKCRSGITSHLFLPLTVLFSSCFLARFSLIFSESLAAFAARVLAVIALVME